MLPTALFLAAVVNGVLAPPLMLLVMIMTGAAVAFFVLSPR